MMGKPQQLGRWILVALVICFGGWLLLQKVTSKVEVTIGPSAKFSQTEIADAVSVVKDSFKEGYDDCRLLKIWYNEADATRTLESFSSQDGYDVDSNNIIVLFCDFRIVEDPLFFFLYPERVNRDWRHILVRKDAQSNWEIKNSGY